MIYTSLSPRLHIYKYPSPLNQHGITYTWIFCGFFRVEIILHYTNNIPQVVSRFQFFYNHLKKVWT